MRVHQPTVWRVCQGARVRSQNHSVACSVTPAEPHTQFHQHRKHHTTFNTTSKTSNITPPSATTAPHINFIHCSTFLHTCIDPSYKFAQCCGFSAHPGAQSQWPVITSNNTITDGFNMTDYEGGMHWQGPGNNSEPHLVNFSDPSSPMHAPGLCQATGETCS